MLGMLRQAVARAPGCAGFRVSAGLRKARFYESYPLRR